MPVTVRGMNDTQTPRTQYFVAASLDGYIADTEGRLDWLFAFNEAEGLDAHIEKYMEGVGAIAMGASTYEFVLAEKPKEWPYKVPCWIFTHRELPRLESDPGADLRFTQADVGLVHAQMVEAAGGKNVWLVGGGNLVAQFALRGLVDELHLAVMPVILGGGAPLLPARVAGELSLDGVTHFPRGVLELRYSFPRDGGRKSPENAAP